MQQSFDPGFHLNKNSVRSASDYLAADSGFNRISIKDILPWIRGEPFKREIQFAFIFIDIQDYDLDLMPDFIKLGEIFHFFPGYLGYMDQAFNSVYVDKNAKRSNTRYIAFQNVIRFYFLEFLALGRRCHSQKRSFLRHNQAVNARIKLNYLYFEFPV